MRNTKKCIPETSQSYLDVCSAAQSSLCRLLLKFFSTKLTKKIDKELQRRALAITIPPKATFALSSRASETRKFVSMRNVTGSISCESDWKKQRM